MQIVAQMIARKPRYVLWYVFLLFVGLAQGLSVSLAESTSNVFSEAEGKTYHYYNEELRAISEVSKKSLPTPDMLRSVDVEYPGASAGVEYVVSFVTNVLTCAKGISAYFIFDHFTETAPAWRVRFEPELELGCGFWIEAVLRASAEKIDRVEVIKSREISPVDSRGRIQADRICSTTNMLEAHSLLIDALRGMLQGGERSHVPTIDK